jgi:predicted RNase H-like HicB family nuclease
MRVAARSAKSEELNHQEYRFTVFFEPIVESPRPLGRNGRKVSRSRAAGPSREAGYQVTVPLLPGLITYGRTLSEARAMARDAIRCHLEGLRKAGEQIPEERHARSERLRVALTA